MKLSEVKKLLNCKMLTKYVENEPDVTACMGTDMMSDVLAFAEPGALLVTGLINSQSVRTAEIADAAGIVYVRGKEPDEHAIELAIELSIPLFTTELSMFETCGILCAAGMKGIC